MFPKQVSLAIEAAADKKANDLVVLDLRKATGFTDFFVICSGTNPRQIRAIADSVTEALAASGAKPAHVEGYERSEWILLDYFDFIVHVFAPETRTLLRPRASVGQRRTPRNQRTYPDAAVPFGFWTRSQHHSLRSACARSPMRCWRCFWLPAARRAPHSLDRPTLGPVCPACWHSILPLTPPLCDVCGDPLPSWRVVSLPLARCARCRRLSRPIDRSRAIGAYDGALRSIVHALKYDGTTVAGEAARRADANAWSGRSLRC